MSQNSLCMHAVMNKYTVAFIIFISGFMDVGETMTASAQDYINQTNSTNMDKQKIVVTWLNTNDSMTGDSHAINISSEDFWKIFGPLLQLSSNKTIGTFE
jgi:hypothetical protein